MKKRQGDDGVGGFAVSVGFGLFAGFGRDDFLKSGGPARKSGMDVQARKGCPERPELYK